MGGAAVEAAAFGLEEDLHSAPGDADDTFGRVLGTVKELEEVLELARVLVLGVALGAARRLGDPAEVRLVTLKEMLVLG